MTRIAGAFLSAACLLSPGGRCPAADGDDVRAAALAAWKKQQEVASDLRLEWEQTDFVPKGSGSETDGVRVPAVKAKGPIPPEDFKATYVVSACFSGGKFTYTRPDPGFDVGEMRWVRHELTYAFDGTTEIQLSGPFGPKPFTHYSANKVTSPPTLLLGIELRPLTAAFRDGNGPRRIVDLEECQLVGRDVPVNGTKCVVFRRRDPRTQEEITVSLSPTANYLPLRIARVHTTGIFKSDQADITYVARAEKGVWVPAGWKSSIISRKGNVIRAYEVKNVKVSFEKVPAEAFAPPPPRASKVFESNDGNLSNAKLVRSDGTIRDMQSSELGTDFGTLDSTEPPRPSRTYRRWVGPVAWAGFSVAAISAIGLVVRSRLRRRNGPTAS